ncbi:MAG: hypothetical protein JWL96_4522 [Sphingomonas bacterium]|uniref:hypothetical protein n=1 Tax=Sphingomonas bacterium TaxID=1895847 RepID=UPI00262C86C1|nr:hypothetical protein [Sphingomonas bacterium]MDB5712452.1 hypothetical protein [Sphingomonas bacterium]
MTFRATTDTQIRISSEIGAARYEAICHFLIDGDYQADHHDDVAGAFHDYANAWSMLVTAKARQLAGLDILEGIDDFANQAGDPKLIEQAGMLIAEYRRETRGDLSEPDRSED